MLNPSRTTWICLASGPNALAAFAEASQVTLVTFDQIVRGKVKPIILLAD